MWKINYPKRNINRTFKTYSEAIHYIYEEGNYLYNYLKEIK